MKILFIIAIYLKKSEFIFRNMSVNVVNSNITKAFQWGIIERLFGNEVNKHYIASIVLSGAIKNNVNLYYENTFS